MHALCPKRMWVLPMLLAGLMIAGRAYAGGDGGECDRCRAMAPCLPAASPCASESSLPANVKVYICAREVKPHHHLCCLAEPPQAPVVYAPSVGFAAPTTVVMPVAVPSFVMLQPAVGIVAGQPAGWPLLAAPQPVLLTTPQAAVTQPQAVLVRGDAQPLGDGLSITSLTALRAVLEAAVAREMSARAATRETAPCPPAAQAAPASPKSKTLEERVSSLERSVDGLEHCVRGLNECVSSQQDAIEQLRKRSAAK